MDVNEHDENSPKTELKIKSFEIQNVNVYIYLIFILHQQSPIQEEEGEEKTNGQAVSSTFTNTSFVEDINYQKFQQLNTL